MSKQLEALETAQQKAHELLSALRVASIEGAQTTAMRKDVNDVARRIRESIEAVKKQTSAVESV